MLPPSLPLRPLHSRTHTQRNGGRSHVRCFAVIVTVVGQTLFAKLKDKSAAGGTPCNTSIFDLFYRVLNETVLRQSIAGV